MVFFTLIWSIKYRLLRRILARRPFLPHRFISYTPGDAVIAKLSIRNGTVSRNSGQDCLTVAQIDHGIEFFVQGSAPTAAVAAAATDGAEAGLAGVVAGGADKAIPIPLYKISWA